MMKLTLVVVLVALVQVSQAANWAVLVAGSNGYYNYRHQADVCHSMQIMRANGIPDSNIITMMYDDIANSPEQPSGLQGNIINRPNGPNVYANVLKDYTSTTVSPSNFLSIITGNSTAMKGIGSGKVLKSGPDDKVFIFFSDHGATGLIAFPTSYLYADDLLKALQYMHDNKMYKELVFYLEACESGSMFQNLPQNINIYTTSASSPTESSYACYYDNLRQTYLGDLYSVSWMENTDAVNVTSETLQAQFQIVKQKTTESTVMQWGTTTFTSEPIGDFMSSHGKVSSSDPISAAERRKLDVLKTHDLADSRDVVLATLRHRYADAKDEHTKAILAEQIQEEIAHRTGSDARIARLTNRLVDGDLQTEVLTAGGKLADSKCLRHFLETYEAHCGKMSDYELKHIRVLNNLCLANADPEQFVETVAELCQH